MRWQSQQRFRISRGRWLRRLRADSNHCRIDCWRTGYRRKRPRSTTHTWFLRAKWASAFKIIMKTTTIEETQPKSFWKRRICNRTWHRSMKALCPRQSFLSTSINRIDSILLTSLRSHLADQRELGSAKWPAPTQHNNQLWTTQRPPRKWNRSKASHRARKVEKVRPISGNRSLSRRQRIPIMTMIQVAENSRSIAPWISARLTKWWRVSQQGV